MNFYQQVSDIFEALSTPARLQIVLAIGQGEACVCHLEALLGLRQAYISQQLMVLREKGLIIARREGKFIYYRLHKPELLDLVVLAKRLADIPPEALERVEQDTCECPSCATT